MIDTEDTDNPQCRRGLDWPGVGIEPDKAIELSPVVRGRAPRPASSAEVCMQVSRCLYS